MSFVGPRPALFNQHDLVALRTEQGVHRLRPGITGWAQINGRDELSIEEKVSLTDNILSERSLVFRFADSRANGIESDSDAKGSLIEGGPRTEAKVLGTVLVLAPRSAGPIDDVQTFEIGEVLGIGGDERQVVLPGDRGDLAVDIWKRPADLLQARPFLTMPRSGCLFVGKDGERRPNHRLKIIFQRGFSLAGR